MAVFVEIMRATHGWGDAYTPEQRSELAASRAGLESVRPHAVHGLETALSLDHSLIRESASGTTARTIRALQLETELRLDRELRADAFVQRWQGLQRLRRSLMEYHEDTKIRKDERHHGRRG
ncbi:MAG: hypothetical protein M3R64_04710 [Pseudomonadota bacterium]|nr:hypothetical protein [Pseudomonadota bacterium]